MAGPFNGVSKRQTAQSGTTRRGWLASTLLHFIDYHRPGDLGVPVFRGTCANSGERGGFQPVPTFHLVVDVAGLGLTAFAVYAGVALWTLKPNVVRTAKTLLIAAFAYNTITDLASLSLGTSVLFWAPTPTVGSTVEDLVGNAISFAIWFTYLKESKRVKATYGSPDAGAATT